MTKPATDDLSIVVVGASGDLAKKKIFPSLFALYCQGYFPENFRVFGFARSEMADDEFRATVEANLTCRYVPGESCAERMAEFLDRCVYVAGQYDSADSFLDLYQRMKEINGARLGNRFFYMAIPPFLFESVARSIGDAGLVACDNSTGWSRVVIEKPFGRDRASSDKLSEEMAKVFTESQTFRIDHYLGKEVIQNLMVLRFANLIFEPLWNSRFIERVEIDWREDIGVEDRAGYFDKYGILRDVMQNHLLQILALIAMEPPRTDSAEHIRNEKVKVLKTIPPLTMNKVKLGRYSTSSSHRGYLEEKGVPADSLAPTFGQATLSIENDRWRGVPFIIRAGKGLDTRKSDVRIRFRSLPDNIFCNSEDCLAANELVIRIQPDEAIYLRIMSKDPGLELSLTESDLNLKYSTEFNTEIPDAYESLLLDVIEGDKSLFIRADELEAAWDIFTPVLDEITNEQIVPEPYEFGGQGPSQ